ncbi:MAG: hypothetical protein IH936_15350 [Acidobacteria bacterium]|nr:hypothetical protein [Acidobacteriota bacterium]
MKIEARGCEERPETVGPSPRREELAETGRGRRRARAWWSRRRASARCLVILTLTSVLNGPHSVALADSMFPGERQVRFSQRLALKRLSQRPACRALFDKLGRSGAQLVADATFRIASPAESRRFCRRGGAALFTTVGGEEVTLCIGVFLRLPTKTQAALLLHEALHHAGVSEQPWDPDGLTSPALTQLVERKCRL